ncbi:MAG: hypothetical protein NC320_08750 [Clostridium sp.]|nr:hypothetical protein [Clostridium sp.]
MNQEIITYIFQAGLTCGIGVVGFFLKRTISELDECKKEICEIKSDHVLTCKEEISDIKENYATVSSVEVCKRDIAKIKEDYITKEDFFREQTENRRKLDRIMDILLEIKGGAK